MKSIYENFGGIYEMKGDYEVPLLVLPQENDLKLVYGDSDTTDI